MYIFDVISAFVALVILVILVMAIDYGCKFFIEWVVNIFKDKDECHIEEGF